MGNNISVLFSSWFSPHRRPKTPMNQQLSVASSPGQASGEPSYPFGPGVKVAVIGAGISGVCTAAHLIIHGADVTVFERSSIAGGVWHYDNRLSADPAYPSQPPSKGDYTVSVPGEHAYPTPPPETSDEGDTTGSGAAKIAPKTDQAADIAIAFSPPGPCYVGLKNNVPTTLMVSSLGPWPEGTEKNVSQSIIEKYVQDLAHNNGVHERTQYGTRVDDVRKSDNGKHWLVRTVTLRYDSSSSAPILTEKTQTFDSVVVASGHYNMPHIPDIPGLKQLKDAFPGRVVHSKQYRSPERFRGRNVLVIGGGVSATDICKELDGVAQTIYRSSRGGKFDVPISFVPESVIRVGEIAQFAIDKDGEVPVNNQEGEIPSPIPGTATLKDGTVLSEIHEVILGTGYITSYPFLPQYHDDKTPAAEASKEVLVTSEGQIVHNLHKDIFYIPDPSLAFVGVPYYTATFSSFDFQAQAVARLLTGKARLPTQEAAWAEYSERVKRKGLGRSLHSLIDDGAELEYVNSLVNWVNEGLEPTDEGRMKGHTREWLNNYQEMKAFRKEQKEQSLANGISK